MAEIGVDAANAKMRMIAPLLAREGAEYERERFEARMRSGDVQLEATKAWLRLAIDAERRGEYIRHDVLQRGRQEAAKARERRRAPARVARKVGSLPATKHAC